MKKLELYASANYSVFYQMFCVHYAYCRGVCNTEVGCALLLLSRIPYQIFINLPFPTIMWFTLDIRRFYCCFFKASHV